MSRLPDEEGCGMLPTVLFLVLGGLVLYWFWRGSRPEDIAERRADELRDRDDEPEDDTPRTPN